MHVLCCDVFIVKFQYDDNDNGMSFVVSVHTKYLNMISLQFHFHNLIRT